MARTEVVVVSGVPKPDAFNCLNDVAASLSFEKLSHVEVHGEALDAPPLLGREMFFMAELGDECLAVTPFDQHASGVLTNEAASSRCFRNIELGREVED